VDVGRQLGEHESFSNRAGHLLPGQKSVGKMMAQEHESQEQEVTAQDQGHINEFSRLNVKYHELEEDLRGKEEVLVNLQDSSNEVREEAAAV